MNRTTSKPHGGLVFGYPSEVLYQELKSACDDMLAPKPEDVAVLGPKFFSDALFAEGNDVCGIYSKTSIIDEDSEDLCHNQIKSFKCDVPNCDLMFDNLLKYELHYNSCHRFSCSQCRKHLPSPHLLDLHLSETHDSFFKVLSEKKPMYRCFVESCKVVCNNVAERKKHCIEVHKFPHDFRFEPKKKKPQAPKKKKPQPGAESSSAAAGQTEDKTEGGKSQEKPGKTTAAGKPITFGRKTGGKSFNKNSKKAESKIEMGELMDTLPEV